MKNKIKDESNLLFLKSKKGILVYGILNVVFFGKRLYRGVGYIGRIVYKVYDKEQKGYLFKPAITLVSLDSSSMKLITKKIQELKIEHNLI